MVIRDLRLKHGMTQEELAKRARVSQGYIAKLEPSARPGTHKKARQANPSIAVLQRLAKALGVPPAALLE